MNRKKRFYSFKFADYQVFYNYVISEVNIQIDGPIGHPNFLL
jgi:hypothetical protein